MLWGTQDWFTGVWQSGAQAALDGGSSCMLSFNEPDNSAQSNLSPSEAAAAHQQYMNPFSGKAQICSPAITNSQSPGEGVDWLEQWIDACDGGCVFDMCCMHWYSPADTQGFFDQITAVGNACGGKPVWVTEFQPSGSAEEVTSFLTDVMQEMDTNPTLNVGAYFYFMVEVGVLMETATTVSPLGELFAYNE